jgi:hypothetical protein
MENRARDILSPNAWQSVGSPNLCGVENQLMQPGLRTLLSDIFR